MRREGYTIFEFQGNGGFRLISTPADFWNDLPGTLREPDKTCKLGDHFPFLEHFMLEAGNIWESPCDACAHSGIWIEKSSNGRDLALEAKALWTEGKPILLIHNPQECYERQVRLQQKGHEAMLNYERLLQEIEKKEILLHCIVHDLVQPLTVMRLCFNLLSANERLPSSLKQTVEMAEAQSRKQEEMIRDILNAFSAELAARKTLEEDPTKAPDLARCEEKAVRTFRDTFIEQSVHLELASEHDPDKVWRVRGDEPHLLRIFGNLLENALRLSPPESTVKMGVMEDGTCVCAFVDDEGPGLPHGEESGRLFALFAKGKELRGGKAGLGLYYCKMTVERWGGMIGCASRPSGGARFWFRLPRV